MKRMLICLIALAAGGLAANPMPDAEAAKLLQEWSQSSPQFQRRSGDTKIFARAQLKYGLERNDYLHRWLDRPLMQDSSFRQHGGFSVVAGTYQDKNFISPATYQTEAVLLKRFGLAGFAFFPESSGRKDLYNHCGTPGYEITVMPEYFYQFVKPGAYDLPGRLAVAEAALNTPQSFRINGKVVLTSYPVSEDLEYWAALKKALTEKFGDRFILMPWGTFDFKLRPSGSGNTYTVSDIRKMREKLRNWLRVVDGFYYNSPAVYNRRYQAEYDREVVIPIIHSVMNEPEFRMKYLGWGVKVGHMNCHHIGYSMDCFGTDMLRGTMDSALLAKPDFINCVEWDEENENTCFRPTMTTSFSTLRVIRNYAQQLKGEAPSMLPGDRPEIPNLVLSYRRILAAGQLLELEVLNIPDGTVKTPLAVTLVLTDCRGKEVRRFPAKMLRPDRLDSAVSTVSSEELVNHQLLLPRLEVEVNGRKQFYADGFQPIELRANWNWDYLWVKQPLRDLASGTRLSLELGTIRSDGLLEVKGKVKSPEPLRSVELVSGVDVVYSHDVKREFARSNDSELVIRISFQGHARPTLLNGSLIWHDAGKVTSSGSNPFRCSGNRWSLKKFSSSQWPIHAFAVIDRAGLDRAELEVNFPGVVQGKIKLAELLKLGSYGFSGPNGFNLVAAPYYSQIAMPEPVNAKEVEFTALVQPNDPRNVFYLQTVDRNYRIYRGAVQSLYRSSGKSAMMPVFAVGDARPVTVAVDRGLLTVAEYDFSPLRGSVLFTPAGRELAGIRGGYTPLVTNIGSGESYYGNPLYSCFVNQSTDQAAPRPVQEPDGSWSLEFDGRQYASLPMALVPPFAGYTVEMTVWPYDLNGTQTLLSNGGAAFTLQLFKGRPNVTVFCNQNSETGRASVRATGPALKPNVWNQLRVRFDQQQLTVETNGVSGAPVPASGYHRYSKYTALGAQESSGDFFRGKIGKLKITPEVEKESTNGK